MGPVDVGIATAFVYCFSFVCIANIFCFFDVLC